MGNLYNCHIKTVSAKPLTYISSHGLKTERSCHMTLATNCMFFNPEIYKDLASPL